MRPAPWVRTGRGKIAEGFSAISVCVLHRELYSEVVPVCYLSLSPKPTGFMDGLLLRLSKELAL